MRLTLAWRLGQHGETHHLEISCTSLTTSLKQNCKHNCHNQLCPQRARPQNWPTKFIPTSDLYSSVTADPGPLNRAEWVKFIAAFFNKEIDANSVYNGIKVTWVICIEI